MKRSICVVCEREIIFPAMEDKKKEHWRHTKGMYANHKAKSKEQEDIEKRLALLSDSDKKSGKA